jgi:hypothetical protein
MIVVLTDGKNNIGELPGPVAEELKAGGVIIFAVGVGNKTDGAELNDRQHNGQNKKDKRTNNELPSIRKDRVTRTPLKIGGELMCSERLSSSCSTSGTHCVNLVLVFCYKETLCN